MLARMKEHKHASQQQANSQQQQTTPSSNTTPTTTTTTTTLNSPAATLPNSNTSSPTGTSSFPTTMQNSSPVIVGSGNSSSMMSSSTNNNSGLQNYDDDNYSKKRTFQEMEQTSSTTSSSYRNDDSSKINKSSHPSNPSNLHHYDENDDEDDVDLSGGNYNNNTNSSYPQGSSSSSGHPTFSSGSRPVAPPSKVLLFSNLPPNCQKSELLEFDTFQECKFQKVFLFKQPAPSGPNRHNKKRKRDGYLAFVEFESIEKAQMFLDKFEGQKIKIRNRTAYLKFSEKQQLEGTPGGLTMNVNEDLNTAVPVSKTVVNTNNATIIHITFTHCDEYNYPLNVDLLFNLFSKFGTIEKINIFIKNELTQSLVQFKSDIEATEAVKEMEGVFVYQDMKLYRMNIQFSKKSREELLIKETNHRNRDYVVHPMRSQKPYDNVRSYNNPPNNNHYAPPLDDPYYDSESSHGGSPERRVPSGNDIDEMMHNRRKPSSPPPYMSSRDTYPPHQYSSAQPSYNNYPPPSSYYPPPSSSSNNGAMMMPPPSSMHSYNGPNDYMGQGFPPMGGPPPMPTHHGVPQPHHGHPQQQQFPPSYSSNGVPPPMHMPMFPPGTCVVIVKNLPVQCTCDHLFVLFGLYGDVIKVSISLSKKDHKTPYMAFIQFKYPHEVGNALRFLGAPFYPTFNKYTPGNTPISSGSTLFGKELHIEPSFRIFDIIPPRSSKSKENDGSKDILFRSYENSPLHRFTPRQGTQESYQANMKKLMNICPPSPVLHISNVSGTTTEDKIRREIDKLFESPNQRKQKSRIVDFKFIDYKKTQTSDHKMKEKKSAIIEMDSIDAATTVLVELHDISIDSHHLNIKFSNRSGSQSSSQSHYDPYYQNDQRSNNNRPRRSSDRMPQQDSMMGENQDN